MRKKLLLYGELWTSSMCTLSWIKIMKPLVEANYDFQAEHENHS